MNSLWAYLPFMFVLLLLSSFFSSSEAAFFSLTPAQRRGLARGSNTDRMAFTLLGQSERLLMAILFWNLGVNVAYFSLASRASLQSGESSAAVWSLAALVVIILFGEFLPKSVAVTCPLSIVRGVVIPLAFAIRLVDVFLPSIRLVNEASRRLLWPGFKSESYLESADLDRAVELSTDDQHLVEQESVILRNVIQLSDIKVEEWMRPRTQYRTFAPPLHIDQLGGKRTPSGYMLVTNKSGKDVAYAVDLSALQPQQVDDLAKLKQPLVIVPWCASVADALTQLRDKGRRVAAIVNEFGETIGILTWEEIFEAILQADHSTSQRSMVRAEIRRDGEGVWLATGMAKIRRLERVLGRRLSGDNLTIAGAIQEQLHRLAEKGDTCEYDGLRLEVIETGMRGEILVRIDTRPMSVEEPGS